AEDQWLGMDSAFHFIVRTQAGLDREDAWPPADADPEAGGLPMAVELVLDIPRLGVIRRLRAGGLCGGAEHSGSAAWRWSQLCWSWPWRWWLRSPWRCAGRRIFVGPVRYSSGTFPARWPGGQRTWCCRCWSGPMGRRIWCGIPAA